MVSRRLFCLGSLTAALVPLGGCGFQPVYMPTATDRPGPAQRELAAVFVELIPERPGQIMRQALQERLGDDSGTSSKYDLVVTFGVGGEGVAVEQDSIATRLRLTGTATYRLLAHDPKRTQLTNGTVHALDGANIADSEYFALDLEVEAIQKRMAENLATQITTQLAVWFRQRAAQQVG